jgi:hypothetical protein
MLRASGSSTTAARRAIAGLFQTVAVCIAQQHRDARDVQSLGNAVRHGFEQRARVHEPARLVAEIAQNLFGAVRFAEKAPVHPPLHPSAVPAAHQEQCRASRQQRHLVGSKSAFILAGIHEDRSSPR